MAEKKKTKTSHRRIVIFIGLLATFLSFFLTRFGFFGNIENKSVDWRFAQRGPIKAEAPVVIVAIDDASFTNMPERWVWPRNFYATAIENLKKWGAKVVAFDVVYSEPTARNPKEDAQFGEAMKKVKNVILGIALITDEQYGSLTRKVFPIDVLAKNAAGFGLVHHAFDSDSNIRKSFLMKLDEDTGDKYLSLAVTAYANYKGIKVSDINRVEGTSNITLGKEVFPNQLFINYVGGPATFKTVPFYQVYFGEERIKDLFRDKIVLIGSTADILHDVFSTPFSHAGYQMPGVEIHANVINTLYAKNQIKKMTGINTFFLVIGIGILTSFMLFAIKAWQGVIVASAEVIIYLILSVVLFSRYNYLLNVTDAVFTIILCYLSMSTYKVAVEEGEKRKIRSVFSRYVSQGLVNELLKSEDIKLGGEKKEVSILFSDIRGFTAMSEKMSPEQVVAILNEYLEAMTDIVFKNHGTLDKFIGDAVMATFGTPVYMKDHAMRAVMTAFMMQKRLAELNEKWTKEGKKTLKIGIGINSGEVVAGNMGSLKRMEYTVIGDAVNLASRLESLNKDLSTEIILSESTYNHVKEFVKAKEYKGIKVKGKEEYLTVYEAISLL